MNNVMGKLQGRGIFLYDLRRALIIPEKSIPEKRVLYVRGKHCGLPGLPGLMQTSHKEDIHTRGTECACAQ